jgi:Rap1a immunity proteins
MFRSRLSLSGIVVIAALMLSGGSAFADELDSANYAMQGCRHYMNLDDNIDPFRQGLCSGLIRCLIYETDDICTPKGVTVAQTARVVVQYIDARPARMHEDFRALALEAMKAAWPCKR